jgi:monofunctional biosynthetic peptidoglycan transglycosylase
MLVFVLAAGAAVLWMTLPDVAGLARDNPATTAFIEMRRARATGRGERFRLRWQWRRLSDISPYLRHAVIDAEDARFWRHEGVDWEAVKQAAEHNWEEKRMAHGASTITQQVAKNLYLSPDRSVVRKLRELFIAWRLEDALDKERILELYVNIAEWGPGVFGVEAAARHWYGCSAGELKAHQAARLAVALPNPFKRSPKTRSRALDRKAARVVRALHRGGLVSEPELVEALQALGQAPTVVAPPPAAGEREEDLPPPVTSEPPEAPVVPDEPPPPDDPPPPAEAQATPDLSP